MISRLLFTVFFLLVIGSLPVSAQSIVGLWAVDQVKVGDQNLTPVAKWFKYHKDKTYQAGNGWTQNDIGTWEYNKANKEFLPESVNGKDEFGPFKVEFAGGKMIWKRMEEGMEVVVSLSRITELPMSPKDRIVGNWELVSVAENGKDITSTYNLENKANILVRWTQTYRKTNPDGTQSFGYWHMDPHQPEFHLIDFDRKVEVQVFTVSFEGNKVVMTGKNSGIKFTYKK